MRRPVAHGEFRALILSVWGTPSVSGAGGEVQVGRELAALLNLADKEAQKHNDQFIASVLKDNVFVAAALSFGYPPEVDVVLREKTGAPVQKDAATGEVNPGNKGNTSWSGKNLLIFPEEFYKGPVTNRMPVPAWFTYLKNREGKTETTASESPDTANLQEAASLRNLMFDYVKYEHFRGRYEKRGGAVNMAWNPYVVPGFPCVVFDHKSSGFHNVGYLNNVTQTLSVGGMSTAIRNANSASATRM